MLLVVPVSNADKKLIPAFVKGFENFHPGNGHKLLVVGNPSISEVIRSVEATLSKYFAESKSFTTSNDNVNGWPMAMNHLFFETARHIGMNYGPEDAFLWMELDSTPLKPEWLTTISKTYFADANVAHSEGREFRQYLGAETITREIRNGEILPTSETGTHMAAVGVYPFDVAARIKMLNVTINVQKAFYEYVQWPIVTNLQKSTLIQHNWMTRNYRREGDEIVSDSANRLAYGVDYNAPVRPDAVLLHGVKDGTLQALLGGSTLPEILPPKPEPLPEMAFTPVKDPLDELVQVFTRDPGTGRITGEEITRRTLLARQAEEERLAAKDAQRLNPIPEIAPDPVVETPIEQPKIEETVTVQEQEPTSEVLLNNNPNPAPKRRKKGPGRPKKIRRQITPEDREARAQRMREASAKRWAKKGEEKADQVNG